MSHKFRKPKPISNARRAAARANGAKSHAPVTPEGKARSAMNAISHGLTANTLVLTTESKEKYDALLSSYRDEYDPQGQTENDLVEELTAAKWLQRRVLSMITALLDVTMDLMDKEIKEQFDTIDNTTRTALAFAKQTGQTAALDLMHRYSARHARDYHRALDKLRLIQSERRGQCILQNEPKPALTPEASSSSGPELVTRHAPLATVLQNEPKPPVTSETGHRPLTTGHFPATSSNSAPPAEHEKEDGDRNAGEEINQRPHERQWRENVVRHSQDRPNEIHG